MDICQCITAILPGVVKHETQIRSDCNQGRSQDVSKGGGGSHCVKHYRRDVFATEYYRSVVFLKKAYKGGSRAPQERPCYAHDCNSSLNENRVQISDVTKRQNCKMEQTKTLRNILCYRNCKQSEVFTYLYIGFPLFRASQEPAKCSRYRGFGDIPGKTAVIVTRMTMMVVVVVVVVLVTDTGKIVKRMVYDPYQRDSVCKNGNIKYFYLFIRLIFELSSRGDCYYNHFLLVFHV